MDVPQQWAQCIIDELFPAAGWVMQDRAAINRKAATGVVVRELRLPADPYDYLHYLAGTAVSLIAAKRYGVSLSDLWEQSVMYKEKQHERTCSTSLTRLIAFHRLAKVVLVLPAQSQSVGDLECWGSSEP